MYKKVSLPSVAVFQSSLSFFVMALVVGLILHFGGLAFELVIGPLPSSSLIYIFYFFIFLFFYFFSFLNLFLGNGNEMSIVFIMHIFIDLQLSQKVWDSN